MTLGLYFLVNLCLISIRAQVPQVAGMLHGSIQLPLPGMLFVLPAALFWLVFVCLANQPIILCCANRRAIIKGSVGNGLPLAFIAKEYF